MATTELSRAFPVYLRMALPFVHPLFNSPSEGALPTLMAATSPDVRPKDYLGPTVRRETARSAAPSRVCGHIRDESVGRRLWDESAKLTGVAYLVDA